MVTAIRKRRSRTAPKTQCAPSKWEVLRTGQGWVPLVEADAHLKELTHCADTSLTIHETDDKKLVLRQKLHGVCTLCDFQKYGDDSLHPKRVSLVRRVSPW